MISRKILLIVISMFFITLNIYAQEEGQQDFENLQDQAPKVFIDSQGMDMNYIRTEITFVNYVRDPKEADVHVLITTQGTGSGGREYTMAFIGQYEHENLQNTLKYFSNSTDTQDEIREGYVQILKLGLAPYVANTPMAKAVSVNFQEIGREEEYQRSTAITDKWDYWVFNIRLSSRLNGQSSRKDAYLSGSISVDRVTDASKFNTDLQANYQENQYEFRGEKNKSTSKSQTLSSLLVFSINDHWSVGGTGTVFSSSIRNYDLSIGAGPALEYNFFPYSESTRRQLRLLYNVEYTYNKYMEMTIFQKMKEGLFSESLTLSFEVNEPWGDAQISLEGAHFFPGFDKRRLSFDAEMSVRLFRGFSLDLNGSYSKIADQINLVAGDATLEEILLERRELASEYEYFVSVGISYRFGSIFSNIVNPRFGSGGGYGGYNGYSGYGGYDDY